MREECILSNETLKPVRSWKGIAILSAVLGLLLATGSATAQTILPPGSVVEGKTIAEWTQDWWTWWFSFPAAIEPFGDEPLTDEVGDHAYDGQSGPVFFINGVTGPTESGPVTRTFLVPAGKHLLLPFITFIFVASAGEACEDTAPAVEMGIDGVDLLFLEIDGVEIPEATLALHRESTGCFEIEVKAAGNGGNEPPGFYPNSYASGYWVMIPPLPPGPHTIHAIGAHSGFNVSIDVTDVMRDGATIPALSAWGIIALAVSLLGAGWFALWRRGRLSVV
jgi:hypothetical protein